MLKEQKKKTQKYNNRVVKSCGCIYFTNDHNQKAVSWDESIEILSDLKNTNLRIEPEIGHKHVFCKFFTQMFEHVYQKLLTTCQLPQTNSSLIRIQNKKCVQDFFLQ